MKPLKVSKDIDLREFWSTVILKEFIKVFKKKVDVWFWDGKKSDAYIAKVKFKDSELTLFFDTTLEDGNLVTTMDIFLGDKGPMEGSSIPPFDFSISEDTDLKSLPKLASKELKGVFKFVTTYLKQEKERKTHYYQVYLYGEDDWFWMDGEWKESNNSDLDPLDNIIKVYGLLKANQVLNSIRKELPYGLTKGIKHSVTFNKVYDERIGEEKVLGGDIFETKSKRPIGILKYTDENGDEYY